MYEGVAQLLAFSDYGSHDGKYIAVALLDSTVKVFFEDSLKFSLSLYGHKLPVSCIAPYGGRCWLSQVICDADLAFHCPSGDVTLLLL